MPAVLVLVAFFAALPWLKTIGRPMALLVTAAVVIFVMGYARYLSFHAQRAMDEVQRAGGAFAAEWGVPAGQAAFGLLLVLPPFKDFATAIVSKFAVDPGTTVDGTIVVFSLALGFVGVVFLQIIGTVIVQAIWWRIKQ